ncbi:hypothetical protein C8J56DRAFT_171399 [Mycena floridula]|nr:hypothetical protein C8J56DRAFT_171399 [Mycena floridula]
MGDLNIMASRANHRIVTGCPMGRCLRHRAGCHAKAVLQGLPSALSFGVLYLDLRGMEISLNSSSNSARRSYGAIKHRDGRQRHIEWLAKEMAAHISRVLPLFFPSSELPRQMVSPWGAPGQRQLELVDATERAVKIPVELCATWTEFDSLMKFMFQSRPENQFIQRGDYELLGETGEQIGPMSWQSWLAPGMRFAMNVVMYRFPNEDSRRCPSCGVLCVDVSLSDDVDCPSCGCVFRFSQGFIEEVADTSNSTSSASESRDTNSNGSEDPHSDDRVRQIRRFHIILRPLGASSSAIDYHNTGATVLRRTQRITLDPDAEELINVVRNDDGSWTPTPPYIYPFSPESGSHSASQQSPLGTLITVSLKSVGRMYSNCRQTVIGLLEAVSATELPYPASSPDRSRVTHSILLLRMLVFLVFQIRTWLLLNLPRRYYDKARPIFDLQDHSNHAWDAYLGFLRSDYKTAITVSGLLFPVIMTVFQIPGASDDALTRATALLSLVCAVLGIGYAFMVKSHFDGAHNTNFVWLMDSRHSARRTWWNAWVVLALPVVWTGWSVILFVISMLFYVWRTGATTDEIRAPLAPGHALALRLTITAVISIGIAGLVLVKRTLPKNTAYYLVSEIPVSPE